MEDKYTVLKVAGLQHDVPVDRAHVEQLKRSIRERGQIAPVLIWEQQDAIIDGFHRVTAMQELLREGCADCENVHVALLDCDKAGFQDARILSACMHKSVSFARITLWVQEMFLATKWAKQLKASEAFRLGGKRGEYISQKVFERHWQKGRTPMSGDELIELATWVKAKSNTWGLSPDQVANMLSLAEIASPMLLPLVTERQSRTEQVLTRPMLQKIAQLIPDHRLQEAVAKKARAERLNEQETQYLVEEVITSTPDRIPQLLTTSWTEQKNRQVAATHGPSLSPEETTVTICEAVGRNLIGWLTKLETQPATADREQLNGVLTGVVISITRYRGTSEDVSDYMQSELARLTKDNKVLRAEVGRLEGQVRGMEKLLQQGREMYMQDTA